MIGIIDYGAGNMRSVSNALDTLGVAWTNVAEPTGIDACERLILPGVGHFASSVERLEASGMMVALREVDKPLLGVCLGAQLLLDASDEAPEVVGLGLIPGRVKRLPTRTVPHMGWNSVEARTDAMLFVNAPKSQYFYFAHSYACEPVDARNIAAQTVHEDHTICAAVQRGTIYGVQFHPEKSANAGLELLRRFASC